MSSSDQPLANVHAPPATTPAPTWTNQTQGFSNSWSTTPSNKVFVFNAVASTAKTSSHATQGPSFSGAGDPRTSSQQKLLSSLQSNNNRFLQNAAEEEESTTELVRMTTRKREYPHRHGASFPYSRPAAARPTFAQAPSFGRDQSQTTNPFSWGGATSETNGNTVWFSGNNANNQGDHSRGTEPVSVQPPVPSQLRTSSHHTRGQRYICQCHPPNSEGEDVCMDCEFCEPPPSKSSKHVQFGLPSGLPQNSSGSGPCHSSFNNCCQHAQTTSTMMEQEAMDTETITQSSSRSHLPSTPCNCNCAMPGNCTSALPPCPLACGCPSRLAHHLRPHLQHGLHQSHVKKKVLFIEEINLEGPVGPLPKCCSHLSRGCAGTTCPNDSAPACMMQANSLPSFQHQMGFKNLPPDDCRSCGNHAFLESQPRSLRGILKAQTVRRHTAMQDSSFEQVPANRCQHSMEKRTAECQSANSTFSREATLGFKRSVNFDPPRLQTEDPTKSSNVDSFDSTSENEDVIFIKRQRAEHR